MYNLNFLSYSIVIRKIYYEITKAYLSRYFCIKKICIFALFFNLLKLKIMPVVVTDETFEDVVLKSDKPVVVDFWAVWCGPCRMVAPVMDQLEKKYGDKIVVAKVDVDKEQKYAAEYGVRNIPTILVFQNGEAIGRQVGVAPFEVFDKAIGQLVAEEN